MVLTIEGFIAVIGLILSAYGLGYANGRIMQQHKKVH